MNERRRIEKAAERAAEIAGTGCPTCNGAPPPGLSFSGAISEVERAELEQHNPPPGPCPDCGSIGDEMNVEFVASDGDGRPAPN